MLSLVGYLLPPQTALARAGSYAFDLVEEHTAGQPVKSFSVALAWSSHDW